MQALSARLALRPLFGPWARQIESLRNPTGAAIATGIQHSLAAARLRARLDEPATSRHLLKAANRWSEPSTECKYPYTQGFPAGLPHDPGPVPSILIYRTWNSNWRKGARMIWHCGESRRNRQRPLPAITLWNVGMKARLCPVGTAMDMAFKIAQPRLQAFSIGVVPTRMRS
jgi:hypothetical protein